MEIVIISAVLLVTGLGAGLMVRSLVARRRALAARKPDFGPQFRFTSSLKASELCEDPIWGR